MQVTIIASLFFASFLPTQSSDGVFRELTFEAASARAKAEDKVVFVDFFTTWCGPCKKLDTTTWVDERVVKWLNDHTIPLKLDAEIETDLAERYKVRVYPTMVFIAADGTERGRLIGYRDAKGFLDEAPKRLAGRTALEDIEEQLAEPDADPMLRMDRAKELARVGRAKEALAEYLFCFDESRDWPGFGGVRVSFLLSDVARLGSEYPPALEALRVRADAAVQRLLDGGEDPADVQDLSSINGYLNRGDETLKIYDLLNAREGVSALTVSMLFDQVIDSLYKAGRFADLINGSNDILGRVELAISRFQETKKYFEDTPPDQSPLAFMQRKIVTDAMKFFKALLAVDDQTTAERLAERLIEFSPTGDTYGSLIKSAAEFEHYATARAFLQRGYANVAEDDQKALKRANRKLPKGERFDPQKSL